MFIIQTNRTKEDFQSYMYEIKQQTWEEFKDYILSKEKFTAKYVKSIYDNFKNHTGKSKRDKVKIYKCTINDDFHLQVVYEDYIVSEYMLVNKVGN